MTDRKPPLPPFPGAVLVEPHAHTAEVSSCSNLPAHTLIELVKAHGYGAVVITDHLLPHTDRARLADGYRRASDAGRALGVIVLPGLELRYRGVGIEDFLVYLPDATLYDTLPDLTALSPKRLFQLAERTGFLVYQAHPFRSMMRQAPAEHLHGIEAHNGNPHHNSHNGRALAHARAQHLRMLSGSDLHELYGAGLGGIWVPPDALTPATFIEYLRGTQPALYIPQSHMKED